ncbi:hypothetical protein [Mesoplasma florum]|uniref:hypothetical protein n=1 Tax=Mesoplasma florum TaxID=2151 RepID=UPI0018E0658C|nr:hypothetical protein [Mesoplasma florum]
MAEKKQAKSKIKIVKPLKKETKKTKELLSDLNVKINNSEVSEKEKRLTLIKTHKKITNLLLKTIPYLLFLFILDVVMLSVITVLFILSAFILDGTAADIVRYILLGVSAFMLAKFTYMNWFSKIYISKRLLYSNINQKLIDKNLEQLEKFHLHQYDS